MIRLANLRYCKVTEVVPGNLVLFAHEATGKWMPCLVVADQGAEEPNSLLGLHFEDGNQVLPPFLLEGVAGQYCLILGKAEFEVPDNLENLSLPVDHGRIALGATGPAIIGQRAGRERNSLPEQCCWLIATGERAQIDPKAPCAGTWEAGVIGTEGRFERLLTHQSII
jgi:hypothetical protein